MQQQLAEENQNIISFFFLIAKVSNANTLVPTLSIT